MYVFIDESGDLGFNSRSTRFFVVAYLVVDQPFEIRTCTNRLLKNLHKTREYARRCNELKFCNSNVKVRRKVLSKISTCQFDLGTIVVEKAKVSQGLRENRTKLYNYVIVHTIMRNTIPNLSFGDNMNVVIDKSMSASSTEGFNKYARNKASWMITVNRKETPISLGDIEIEHVNSENEPCLQAADFSAGALFQRYERNDHSYLQFLVNKIKYPDYYWP